eukprot:scaffold187254_cov59-Attheya_sp.AAC.2
MEAQKEEYSVTLDHRQARRIAREWSKKRTLETNEKQRKAVLDSIDNYDISFAPVRMSHVMGDIPIKLQKNSTATKDEDDDKVLTQRLEQLYDDGKRKNEVPLFYGGDAEAMIQAHENFTNFRKCLRDAARDDWDTAKVGQDMTIAVTNLTELIRIDGKTAAHI